MTQRLQYEPAMDGLRAVAVTAVMLSHAYTQYLPGGWVGVEIFFVLSGYLITRLLIAENAATGRIDLPRFYIRRALRLMPALWCLLAFMGLIFATSDDAAALSKSWVMAATYLMNWNRAFGWWPQDYLGHTWSLAIEEQYYLLWPLIFLVIRRHALTLIGSLIAAAILWRLWLLLQGAGYDRLYNGFDTHADPLLIGCALAYLKITEGWEQKISRGWPVYATVIGAASLFGISQPMLVAGIPLIAVMSAGLIVASRRGFFNRALSLPPLVFTGKISYGLYLWHFPLLKLASVNFPGTKAIVVLAATYCIASLSWFTVERYFRHLKVKLEAGQFDLYARTLRRVGD